MSANSATGARLSYYLPQLIVRHFFGAEEKPVSELVEPDQNFLQRASRLTGGYRSTRRSYSKIEKLGSLQSSVDVSLSPDGYLLTSIMDEVIRWVEIEPLLFLEHGGHRRLAFRENGKGEITHVFPGFMVGISGEKIGFFDSMAWFVLIVSLAVAGAIGTAISGWLRRNASVEQTRAETLAGRMMTWLALVWLLFFVLFSLAMVQLLSGAFFEPFPAPLMYVSLWVLVIAAILTALAVPGLYPVWRDGSWPVWRRLRHTLVLVILVATVLTLNDWNVLGFRYM